MPSTSFFDDVTRHQLGMDQGGAAGGTLVVSNPTAHAEVKLKEKPDSVEFNSFYGLLCDLDVKKR